MPRQQDEDNSEANAGKLTDVTGLTEEERLAVETIYRTFSEGRPDLLDQAVAPDWQDIPLAPG